MARWSRAPGGGAVFAVTVACLGCVGGRTAESVASDGGADAAADGQELPTLPADCPSVPPMGAASAEEREALFDFLSSAEWSSNGQRLRFDRGGRFRWDRYWGAFRPSREGRWTLHAHGPGAGVVVLDDGAVLPVRRRGEFLVVDSDELVASGARALASEDGHLRAADLREVALPPELAKLVRICWEKANDLQPRREPRFLTLLEDGHFRVTETAPGVFEDGVYSFDSGAKGPELSLLSEQDRAAGAHGLGWRPVLVEDLLVLEDPGGLFTSRALTFRRAGAAGGRIFVERGTDLDLVGRYHGRPVAGTAFTLFLSLRAHAERLRATSVKVAAAPGTTDEGTLDLVVLPGAEQIVEVTVVLPTASLTRLSIELEVMKDDGKPVIPFINPLRLEFQLAIDPAP